MGENGAERARENVEKIAEDVRARVGEATDQARAELADVQARMRELRREMVSRAMAVKDRAVEELQSAAQRIRREAEEVGDAEVVSKASELAEGLERTASYLDRQNLEQFGREVTQTAQQNVWQVLGIAFIIGLTVGLLVGIMSKQK